MPHLLTPRRILKKPLIPQPVDQEFLQIQKSCKSQIDSNKTSESIMSQTKLIGKLRDCHDLMEVTWAEQASAQDELLTTPFLVVP
jgi:hypothetical protein